MVLSIFLLSSVSDGLAVSGQVERVPMCFLGQVERVLFVPGEGANVFSKGLMFSAWLIS